MPHNSENSIQYFRPKCSQCNAAWWWLKWGGGRPPAIGSPRNQTDIDSPLWNSPTPTTPLRLLHVKKGKLKTLCFLPLPSSSSSSPARTKQLQKPLLYSQPLAHGLKDNRQLHHKHCESCLTGRTNGGPFRQPPEKAAQDHVCSSKTSERQSRQGTSSSKQHCSTHLLSLREIGIESQTKQTLVALPPPSKSDLEFVSKQDFSIQIWGILTSAISL
jgi:hypothetical protein